MSAAAVPTVSGKNARVRAAAGVRALCAALVFGFLILPTLFIFPLALAKNDVLAFPPQGIGWSHFAHVFTQPLWRDAFLTSFQVCGLAALLATIFGTLCAVVIPGGQRFLAKPLELTVVMPLIVPPVVLAVGWFDVFSRLHLVGHMIAVAIAYMFLGLPLVYLNVSASLARLDRNVLRASRSLGGGALTTFVRVVLPLVAPGVIGGAVLTFVIAFDELIIALFVGGGLVNTLPVVMWGQINYVLSPDVAAAAAVSVVVNMIAAAILLVIWRLNRVRGGRAWRR